MTRWANADDLHDICAALSEVEFGTSWGDRPAYKVQGKAWAGKAPKTLTKKHFDND